MGIESISSLTTAVALGIHRLRNHVTAARGVGVVCVHRSSLVSGDRLSNSIRLPVNLLFRPSDFIMPSLVIHPSLPAVSTAPPGVYGKMYLVGMGPGNADLVTFRAAEILKDADCVFCFAYLKDEVARFASPAKIAVASPLLMGRVCGRKAAELPPERREELEQSKAELSEFAAKVRNMVAASKTVVIADAGDPAVYCPWSWVTEEFADLQPTIVPGLSSFSAANAALRQSITQYSGSVLISGGEDLGTPDKDGRLKIDAGAVHLPREAKGFGAAIAIPLPGRHACGDSLRGKLSDAMRRVGHTRDDLGKNGQ